MFRAPRDPAGSTEALAARVARASARQAERNPGHRANGRLEGRELEAVTEGPDSVTEELERAMRVFHVSARGRTRILRLARTLADLEDRDELRVEDVRLAVRLRGSDR